MVAQPCCGVILIVVVLRKFFCNQQGTSTRRSYQNARHEVLRHNGQVYISTRTPIFTERRPGEGKFTVLLLSDTARKGLEREAINSALFAAIVAFLATLIIYPSILLLTRRIESYRIICCTRIWR